MNERTVRQQENRAWSSEKISERHKYWGYALPAVDLDFVLVEMNGGKPAAVIEHKYMSQCGKVDVHSATFNALSILANAAAVPLLLVFYDYRPSWWFAVEPVNSFARAIVKRRTTMSEREYVDMLYRARGIVCPHQLLNTLDSYKPEVIP